MADMIEMKIGSDISSLYPENVTLLDCWDFTAVCIYS
jgi:hypothetical protein